MYENVHPNLALVLLFVRTEVKCGKGLLVYYFSKIVPMGGGSPGWNSVVDAALDLVITAAKHLDTTCTLKLVMCKLCRAQRVKLHGTMHKIGLN